MHERRSTGSKILTVFFSLLSIVWLIPIFEVLLNSFKSNGAVNSEPFALPTSETFMGLGNYIKGMTFGNYPFLNSVFCIKVNIGHIACFDSFNFFFIF